MNYPCLRFAWKRPNDVPFPNVWHRFSVKSDDGKEYKIRIQDISPDRYDEVWEMYEKYFFADEDLHKAANEIVDEVSMESYKWYFHCCFDQRLTIIAVLDEECQKPKLVGGLGLMVSSKNDPAFPRLPGIARAKMQNLMKKALGSLNVFEELDIDLHFDGFGLVVKPEYRRLGIGTELFRTIERMARTFGIPAAVITFNNDASQAMAMKLGFEVLHQTKLQDYVDEDGEKILPTATADAVKLTYLRYC